MTDRSTGLSASRSCLSSPPASDFPAASELFLLFYFSSKRANIDLFQISVVSYVFSKPADDILVNGICAAENAESAKTASVHVCAAGSHGKIACETGKPAHGKISTAYHVTVRNCRHPMTNVYDQSPNES